VLSFSVWSDWSRSAASMRSPAPPCSTCSDQLTSNLLLPIGGLAIALFAGWALPRRMLR